MKQLTNNTLKSFFATLLLSGLLTFNASAQKAETGPIVSEVKVKETTLGNALLDVSINNKSTSPFQVVIRDQSGNIIFKEWAKGDVYLKRFKLDIFDSNEFNFEVIQDKKLVDTKVFKVTRRMEEKIEVYAVN